MPNTPSRDAAHWAAPVSNLKITDVPTGAINLNLDGREIVGPLQGFGQMWQKTFRVRLPGVNATPAEVMRIWKANFPKFQPKDNHFYPSLAGIQPGEVIWIDSKLPVIPGLPGLVPIAAGVMVLYADDECFTVMTPEGFPVAGWNTFSAYDDHGVTVAQAESIDRPADPIYEFGFRLMGGMAKQDQAWVYVMTQLAAHFGVQGHVEVRQVCLDPNLQWRYAGEVWRNAALRTTFYLLAAPLRWLGRLLKR